MGKNHRSTQRPPHPRPSLAELGISHVALTGATCEIPSSARGGGGGGGGGRSLGTPIVAGTQNGERPNDAFQLLIMVLTIQYNLKIVTLIELFCPEITKILDISLFLCCCFFFWKF